MAKITLNAQARKVLGRKVKTLRKEGQVPANIFGKKVKSSSISVDLKEFEKVFEEAGETGIVDLVLGKDDKAVLIRNVQVDPVESRVLHIDFQQVDLTEKVTAKVPVVTIGESQAVKQGLGTLVQQVSEIEVEALPRELPEKFEIDIKDLAEVDQSISVGDIKVDSKKIEIKDDPEKIVVKVEPLHKEEVVEVAPVEGETPVEGAPVEGEQPSSETATQPEENTKK